MKPTSFKDIILLKIKYTKKKIEGKKYNKIRGKPHVPLIKKREKGDKIIGI